MARLRRLRGTPRAHTGRHARRDLRSAGRRVARSVPDRTCHRYRAAGGEFGWHRLLLSGDKPVIDGFAARRASGLSASSTLTCCGRSRRPSLIALITRWTRPGAGTLTGLVNRAIKAASEGGKGALGWAEVLDSLVQHRVEHLVFAVNAPPNHETLAPHVSDALGKPSAEMLVERALEHAVASGADVTTVPDDAGPLLSVGGVVATLRY